MIQVNGTGKIYMSADGKTFEPLGTFQDMSLSCDSEEKKDITYFFNKSCTFYGTIEHFDYIAFIAIISGKKLFAKCPKKIRRSRKYRHLLQPK